MTFNLVAIGVLLIGALIIRFICPAAYRRPLLFISSVAAIFWFQPVLPIRFSSFWFPLATILLTVAVWWWTRAADSPLYPFPKREDRNSFLLLLLLLLGLSLLRYVPIEYRFIVASRPPSLVLIGGFGLILTAIVAAIGMLQKRIEARYGLAIVTLLLLGLLLLLKWTPSAVALSQLWRGAMAQDVSLASPIDLNWLGFSYLVFRLIHVVRERQTGRFTPIPLRDFIIYVIFPAAFIAGPIDRVERFYADLQQLEQPASLLSPRVLGAAQRILLGMGKKFVIADSLALGLAMTPLNVTQATSTGGLWLLLYGYAFRLYFDFAGYSDIAIGLGMLLGIDLPENFRRPYLTNNITRFWQSWHITLSDWIRTYLFSPLSRALLRRKPRPSPTLIVFTTQMATMIAIGLWHGITLNFLLWGIWHGLALFVHKKWSDRTRSWYRQLQQTTWRRRVWHGAGWVITFHYVVVGWIWFVIPETGLAWQTMLRLFGVGWGA